MTVHQVEEGKVRQNVLEREQGLSCADTVRWNTECTGVYSLSPREPTDTAVLLYSKSHGL